MSERIPIHVVRGSDPILVADAVRSLVDELIGTADRSLALDEFSGDDYDLGHVVDAASTPPLFGDHRVVVARGAGRFSKADDAAPLVTYLEDPMESSVIVLVWELGTGQQRLSAIPKKLTAAIEGAGGALTTTDPGSSRGAKDSWYSELFAGAGISLSRDAQRIIRDRLGEDLSGAPGILRLLEGAYGQGAKVDAAAVEPFLGQSGGVPPWELTDAIDRGDAAGALDALHRMLGAGERHPLQIMTTLTSSYLRIARLSGSGVGNEKDAAALLGMKGSTFPAKKALTTTASLGPTGAHRAIELCAEADLTLRGGGVAWDGELVLEVLVARLCRLVRGRSGRSPARGAVSSRR